MPALRQKVETGFEILAGWVFHHSWSVIIGVSLLTLFLTYPLPRLTVDSSSQAMLHRDDVVLGNYRAFVDLFGPDEYIIVAVESPRLFTFDSLKKLQSLHRDLADKTPFLEEITSLINARHVRGEEGQLVVGKLLENLPRTGEELDRLREQVLTNDLYLNRLISADGGLTCILITTQPGDGSLEPADPLAGFETRRTARPVTGPDQAARSKLRQRAFNQTLEAVKEIVAGYESEDFKIFLSGPGIVSKTVNESGMEDMALFVGLALAVICALLLIMFGRLSGMVLPPLIVGLATASAMGLMAHAGVVFTPPTIMLPSFLLAVGTADSVHLLTLFYSNLARTGDKGSSIARALGLSGPAILMTSLTTAAGLGSFMTAKVTSVAHIGLFGSAGVLLALAYTLLLLPALLAVLPIKAKPAGRNLPVLKAMDNLLDRVADFSCGHPKAILSVGLVAVLIALTGIGQIRFFHHPVKWLPQDWPERLAAERIDRRMKGSMTLDVLIDTGRTNGALEPATLKTVDRLAAGLKEDETSPLKVGQTSSLPGLIKEINRALHENRPEHYRLPDDPGLIAQEVLLFENSGSSDLRDWADEAYRTTRVTIQTPWANALIFASFIEKVEAQFKEDLDPGFGVTATGQMSLLGQTITTAIKSTARSYIIAIMLITIMMILAIGRLKLGLISMIPNLTPIIIVMGLIGWLDIPFDLFSLVIGSIAIGLVVDDTIHFVHAVRRCSDSTPDIARAVKKSFRTVGRALIMTTVVLASASFIFMLAQIKAMVNFGFLIGLTIVLALVADLVLTPALLVLVHPGPGRAASGPSDFPEQGKTR